MYIILGSVFVGLKDAVFEHSTPFRHVCELHQILQTTSFTKPVLFLYSDGGPDHRLTYFSVKLSLICLFLTLDLDYLCAGRTAPYHSWRNPVERVMSILNLGLQCVGLARSKMGDEFEKEVAKCSNLSELRQHLEGMKADVDDSLSPVKILLCTLFCRLKLHDQFIGTFTSASTSELSHFWSAIIALDNTLTEHGVYRQDTMNRHSQIMEFIDHCCQCSHYTFDILECGKESCTICRPVCLPLNIFKTLHHIPHPTPGDDEHYLSFSEVFGTTTTEEHRPSYTSKKTPRVKRKLSYYASKQHVKNSQLMVQCSECELWRIIFSKYKLKDHQISYLRDVLDDFTYSCGASLKDLNLSEEYKFVDIRDHDCYDPVEKLYYSAEYTPICVYCAAEYPYTTSDRYPQCDKCQDKPPISK